MRQISNALRNACATSARLSPRTRWSTVSRPFGHQVAGAFVNSLGLIIAVCRVEPCSAGRTEIPGNSRREDASTPLARSAVRLAHPIPAERTTPLLRDHLSCLRQYAEPDGSGDVGDIDWWAAVAEFGAPCAAQLVPMLPAQRHRPSTVRGGREVRARGGEGARCFSNSAIISAWLLSSSDLSVSICHRVLDSRALSSRARRCATGLICHTYPKAPRPRFDPDTFPLATGRFSGDFGDPCLGGYSPCHAAARISRSRLKQTAHIPPCPPPTPRDPVLRRTPIGGMQWSCPDCRRPISAPPPEVGGRARRRRARLSSASTLASCFPPARQPPPSRTDQGRLPPRFRRHVTSFAAAACNGDHVDEAIASARSILRSPGMRADPRAPFSEAPRARASALTPPTTHVPDGLGCL